MIKDKKSTIEYVISFVMLAIAVWGTWTIVTKTTGNDIWYDEVFSMVFAGKPVKEVISLTAADVHPPLYYIYLKMICQLGGLLGLTQVVAAKIASVIPLLVIDVLVLTYVRKRQGVVCASAIAMLLSIMPQLPTFFVEIRMYSFAMLLIFLAYLFGGRIIEKGKATDYIAFCTVGILTAYTQYFACIAIVGLYLYIGVCFCIMKRIKDIRRLLVCGLASVIAYIPWIPEFISQTSAVRSNYWIQPMDIKSVPGCIKFFFLPMAGAKGYASAAAGILAVLIVYFVAIRKKDASIEEKYYEFAPYAMLAIIVMVGYIFSFLGRPIFVYRYMIPVAAALYSAFAIALNRVALTWKNIAWVLILPLVWIGYYSVNVFNIEESSKLEKIDYALESLNSLPDDSVIIANFDQIAVLMDYYLPDKDIYVYEGSVDASAALMYDNDGQSLMETELDSVVSTHNNVYLFGSFNSREELLEEYKIKGIDNELVFDSCMIERYYFNVYKLIK